MRITPRADEKKTLVEILTSDNYETPEEMAAACLKAAASLLDMRDWVALTVETGSGAYASFGPYASESEALRAAKALDVTGTAHVTKLHAPGVLAANIGGKADARGYCQNRDCGHASWLHAFDGSGRGRCGLGSCPCTVFKK